ncbi:MAG: flavin monoamine oxidase family protein [Blastocatellia bacterium]
MGLSGPPKNSERPDSIKTDKPEPAAGVSSNCGERRGRSRVGYSLTRRELLAGFLGLPLAMAACRRGSTPSLPPGDIVGASNLIGHKIRDGLRPEPARDSWKTIGVVIVGGGIAGLSAAWRLQKAGFDDFVVLELEEAPGGTARSGTSSVIPFPWGAHYIPAPMKENTWLTGLLEEMGLIEGTDNDGEPIVGEQFLCRDPEERIFFKGRWYEGLYLHAGATPEDERQLQAFRALVDRWVGWRDSKGRRAFGIPVATASDDAEVTALDKISMSQWMQQQGLNSARLRWLVDYSCRDDYGSTMEDTSAWAGIFYFASRVVKPGQDSRPLVTWPEGNGHLVSYFYDKVKAKVRLGAAVTDINPSLARTRAGVDVITVNHDGGNPYGYHADRVIFAAPQFLSKFLIRPYRDETPAHVSEFQYGAWIVANLQVTDRPVSEGFPLAWDNVLYESPSLGYVVATHQRGLDYGPSVFTYYYPLCDRDPKTARERALSTDRDGWADIALSDLEIAHHNIRSLVQCLDVMRWGHAMIKPRPGFISSPARETAARPYRGIHFANTDLSGVALFEEAFYHGIRAAEEILHQRSGARS